DDSVALGADSVADRAGTISVGSGGSERQIVNVAAGTEDTDAVNLAQLNEVSDGVAVISDTAVFYDDGSHGTVTLAGADGTVLTNLAAGEVSADSTDAITGSQLFETNERVGVVEGRVDDLDGRIGDVEGVAANAITYDDDSRAVATLDGANGTRLTNLAAGSVNAASTDAVTGAQLYGSMNSVATALGGGTVVDANGRLIGTVYSVQGSYYGNVGEALGALDSHIDLLGRRLADVEGQVVNPTNTGNDRVAVGGQRKAVIGEETNAIAVGDGAYAHGPNDIAIGGNAHVGADGSTAVGANATISAEATNAIAMGEGAGVSAASGTALGQGASVTAEGAVALGQGSVADRANTVSVGSVGNERQVTNVAAGTADTDAANVAQVKEARAYADSVGTQTLGAANAYTDQQ